MTFLQGLPYEYIVKHPEMSTGFADAPAEIREVMRKLIWVGQKGLDDGSNVTLNECLAVGYFDNGSMSVRSLKTSRPKNMRN